MIFVTLCPIVTLLGQDDTVFGYFNIRNNWWSDKLDVNALEFSHNYNHVTLMMMIGV